MTSLEDVREGMEVVDASGERVGTVRTVKMGNPEATTAEGQTAGEHHTLLDAFVDAFSQSNRLPEEQQDRLLRLGFIEVDAVGLGGDFYVASDEVGEISDEVVRLTVSGAAS